MHKKIFLYLFIFSSLLWGLSPASGRRPDPNGLEEVRRVATPFIASKDGSDEGPGNGEYEALQDQLKALMDELKKLEEDAENKIRKEMIPFIKREIERLREWLKKLRPGKDREEPVLTRFDNERVSGTPFGPSFMA